VELQRKQRLWAAQDVRELVCVNLIQVCVNLTQVCVNLTQVCVNLTQVLALGVSVHQLRPDAAVLPLDVFDNTEYDSRTTREWLPRSHGEPGTPARAVNLPATAPLFVPLCRRWTCSTTRSTTAAPPASGCHGATGSPAPRHER
jgi:hypothetical protein